MNYGYCLTLQVTIESWLWDHLQSIATIVTASLYQSFYLQIPSLFVAISHPKRIACSSGSQEGLIVLIQRQLRRQASYGSQASAKRNSVLQYSPTSCYLSHRLFLSSSTKWTLLSLIHSLMAFLRRGYGSQVSLWLWLFSFSTGETQDVGLHLHHHRHQPLHEWQSLTSSSSWTWVVPCCYWSRKRADLGPSSVPSSCCLEPRSCWFLCGFSAQADPGLGCHR